MLRAGGNAVDGAVAANAVLGVVRPDTCGPGGDLFALVHRPGDSQPLTLNASGRAGTGRTAADLRNDGLEEIPIYGRESITVPGCVDGWITLLDELGTLGLDATLAPAIELAEDGFEVSAELAGSLRRLEDALGDQTSASGLYPGGVPAPTGGVVRRPDHADTLRTLAAGDRDAFYLDTIGDGIVGLTRGLITYDDLARSQSEWVQPLGADIVDLTGWTTPPNSQGYLTLAALWMAERLLPTSDPDDAVFQHTLIEAYRAAAEDRDDVVTEPATAPLSPEELVAPDRLEDKMRSIDMAQAALYRPLRPVPGGTMHLSVRDAYGAGVSLIQSNFHGIGARRSIDGTGIFLHNRGAGFNLVPGHPNELVGGHRPLHTLSPTLWTNAEAELEMLMGTRGGHYQPQLLLQVLARVRFAGQTLADAVAAPRWVVDNWNGPGHEVRIEAVGETFCDQLRSRGHAVTQLERWQRGWGPIAAIHVTDDTVEATGDPRVSTSGVAVA